MIIIKCEDELLMLSGNAYIKAIKIDIPDNDKELTGKLDIYCQEFRKTALSITYDKKVVEKLLNECMTAIEAEMSCAPDCNTNIFIDLKSIIDCAIKKVERGLENDWILYRRDNRAKRRYRSYINKSYHSYRAFPVG